MNMIIPTFTPAKKTEGCDPNWSEKSWPTSYRQFQQRLYERVKADPRATSSSCGYGAHGTSRQSRTVRAISSGICDKGNDHSYPGSWGKPSQESGWGRESVRSMDEVVAKVQQVCPGKKLWITETGYEEKRSHVTREAKAKYLPRIYANYYLQGQIEKTFLFELLSAVTTQPTEFGIIDTNLQPTPAYYAIKNMISLLGEASWNQQTQVLAISRF